MLRRTFDLFASSLGLLLLSPILLIIAAAIKCESPGPAFYRGLRAGRNGKAFRILKFRSMVMNAEKLGGPSTSDKDPRITRIGRMLRKLKLDELPQLLNVLRGEMSLVGPRPQVRGYVARYSAEERAVLQVRPGITDWASIWNSDEGAILAMHPDPDRAYDELIHPTKMQLQLLYARHHNLWIDLKILAYTTYKLLRKSWLPAEIRHYPRPGCTAAPTTLSFESVTEVPGTGANAEQLAMLDTRYGWAGQYVRGKEVLEVACGSGIGLGYLATEAKRVVGGDFDSKLTEIARRHYNGRIAVHQFDAHSLPFADASFDIVLLFEAIYYLSEPDAFVREAHRVLRPNGQLLICSANCERPDFNVSPFSKRYYSANALHELLERNKFQAEIYAGFPLKARGWVDHAVRACRTVAIKLRLIPKSMKWKARIKRVVFGKLQRLPTSLGPSLPAMQPVLAVDAALPEPGYKVLYAIGRRRAVEQRLAA